jgi:hypothetical protein
VVIDAQGIVRAVRVQPGRPMAADEVLVLVKGALGRT